MKKFLAVALFCFSATSFAQLIQFGPQISTNSTNISTKGYADDSADTTIGFGAFARVNLLNFYGQGEIGFGKTQFSVNDGFGKTEYDLSGTDFTLLAGFKILPLGKLGNVRLFGGYNWKNYSSIDANNNASPVDFKKNNSSVIAGAGVDLWKFTLDYRYLIGVSDLDDSPNEIKTGISNFTLGFKF
ncbi:outer membrane beta-barrel protein [Flavobacterium agrisoli]|uniref:Porin family protein n=1 Tax=Flavobacterium agrisoli TaxID=2793066 RepID=A0A934UJE8_9FLAO|nr:outer membrane beta-barrel protein [Flavobacterium agrisoli]MBK0369886.1 porin family protein [Flavobacterium agrisoli]